MTREETAIKIVKEMLIDRGYTISNRSSSTLSECTTIITRSTEVLEEKDYECYAENGSKRILVFLCREDKLKIQEAKEKIYVMNRENVKRCIIIYMNDITPTAKKSFETIQEYNIELFSVKELQFNITTHRLVPKHTLATDAEKEELKIYHNKLPVLLYTDVIRRYYDYKRGDIIRITRKDNSMIYRVVK
jgi:DNA-directed RNA polymerase subunit H (RpoH/RPB5)